MSDKYSQTGEDMQSKMSILAKNVRMRIAYLGAGHIASKMAATVQKLPGVESCAVGSRDIRRSEEFAARWGVRKAYGSYEDLVRDPEVDLVYVATPNSHHFDHSLMAIRAGKPVLCEKAFTMNAREAEALVREARSRGVFLCEAVWTRFMPLSHKIKELLDSGVIGRPRQMSASLCYAMESKERILRPELGGGSLLDLGVYCLNFARMYFGPEIVGTDSSCILGESGTDMYESMTLRWADGKVACLQSSALSRCNREGLITGDEGYIVVDNINCPQAVRVYKGYQLVEEHFPPASQISGYEYELLACKDALERGLLESECMPHSESVAIMKQMDALRREWGVKFPE